ncbi:MAG: hypothetical protein GX040_06670 [Alcaligenaceae bacterium]|nr:hypothetical protein [Alcaligenaceae bacterium]
MSIKKFVNLTILGATFLLAGCETIELFPDDRKGGTLLSDVPVLPVEQEPLRQPSGLPQQPAGVASSLVIYVSSMTPLAGYIPVQQSGQLVYVDPSQTLIRNDLQNAITKQDGAGNVYVDLHFSGQGSAKLADFTSRNIGKNLTVTMNNKLVSILAINEGISTGHLFVPMTTAAQASDLEQRIQDGE